MIGDQPRDRGRCIFCAVGKHEKCTDVLSVIGCGCPCNDEDEEDP